MTTCPTKRVNVSVPTALLELIQALAYRDNTPVTTKTLELVKKGLEQEEDLAFVEIMEARSQEMTNKDDWISHDDFWDKALS